MTYNIATAYLPNAHTLPADDENYRQLVQAGWEPFFAATEDGKRDKVWFRSTNETPGPFPVGAEVGIVPMSGNEMWPTKSLVRFVGNVVAYTPSHIVVRGVWHRWTKKPDKVTEDTWPHTQVRTHEKNWRGAQMEYVKTVFEPYAWRVEPDGPSVWGFPLQQVAIFAVPAK